MNKKLILLVTFLFSLLSVFAEASNPQTGKTVEEKTDNSKKHYIYEKIAQSNQLYEGYQLSNEKGLEYMNSGNYDAAIREFEVARQMIPTNATAYINLGVAYTKLAKAQDAITRLSQAASFDPENYIIYYDLGNVYFELLGNYQEAIQWYLTAIQKNPNDAKSYLNLGISYLKLGQNAEAKTSLEKARDIFAQNGDNDGVSSAEKNLKTLPE